MPVHAVTAAHKSHLVMFAVVTGTAGRLCGEDCPVASPAAADDGAEAS